MFFPPELAEMAGAAADACKVEGLDWESFADRPATETDLPTAKPEDICYLQYSSGSTRFPHGVAVTHHALLSNLAAHSHGMDIDGTDRCISWLPWYHDMGLVGCMLSMVANQVSTDYLKTEDFARRPLAWLDLISRNPGNSCSYSPTFGYDICARRIGSQSKVSERFDLSRWRIAGNGADMIRPDVMQNFVNAFADAGFKASAFLPSYGLAEATLAVTLMPPGEGIVVELVEETKLSGQPQGAEKPVRYRSIVNCGKPARGMSVEIRTEHGEALPEKAIGKIWTAGPSIMHSYFRDAEATEACMVDGWLDTGDMGYMSDGYLYVVGRAKGHDHHQRQEPLAAGYRMGGGTASRLQIGRHRGVRRDHPPGGEETPAVLVQCRTSDEAERLRLRDEIREKVRSITGMNCVIELVSATHPSAHEFRQTEPREGA